jgi:hypothetical protein
MTKIPVFTGRIILPTKSVKLNGYLPFREKVFPFFDTTATLAERELVHKEQIGDKFFFVDGQHQLLMLIGTGFNLALLAWLQHQLKLG